MALAVTCSVYCPGGTRSARSIRGAAQSPACPAATGAERPSTRSVHVASQATWRDVPLTDRSSVDARPAARGYNGEASASRTGPAQRTEPSGSTTTGARV